MAGVVGDQVGADLTPEEEAAAIASGWGDDVADDGAEGDDDTGAGVAAQ